MYKTTASQVFSDNQIKVILNKYTNKAITADRMSIVYL